jgi:hypothetical protein
MKMLELSPGIAFRYRACPRWQFWRRASGAAQLIATEPDGSILHLRAFALDGSVISHFPILTHCVTRFIAEIYGPSVPVAPVDEPCRAAVIRWRAAHAAGSAGVFSVPVGEAVDRINDTLPREIAELPYVVESAYPVRGQDGTFRTIHVITAG